MARQRKNPNSPSPWILGTTTAYNPNNGYELYKSIAELSIYLREYFGWINIASCFGLTDAPDRLYHYSSIPSADALQSTFQNEKIRPYFQQVMNLSLWNEFRLMYGMAYSPTPHFPPPEAVNWYYLNVIIQVKNDKIVPFTDMMGEKIIPMFAKEGLHLISAAQPVDSYPDTVHHLWHIKDANSLLEIMRKLSENIDYAKLNDLCESQNQQLLYSGKYNAIIVPPLKKKASSGRR